MSSMKIAKALVLLLLCPSVSAQELGGEYRQYFLFPTKFCS